MAENVVSEPLTLVASTFVEPVINFISVNAGVRILILEVKFIVIVSPVFALSVLVELLDRKLVTVTATVSVKSEPSPPTSEDNEVRQFGDPLILGVLENLNELDGIIEEQTRNWDIERIARVDRNILRLAIYEMLHRDDIPPVVSINEAIDIAKKFSTENSGRFVNGILDKVKVKLMRPARTSAN